MKKLNLGCGDRKMYGYVNVDARADVHPDVVCDIAKISTQFQDADVIYACHVLEHFPNKPSTFQPVSWRDVLKDWHKTLKPGGTLRLAVPDIEATCRYYLNTGDLGAMYAFWYGGQKYDFDYHYHCWSPETLIRDLKELGFENVRQYDWKETDHSYVDDYSQAYLPHMDKTNGQLMSLNVEASKKNF